MWPKRRVKVEGKGNFLNSDDLKEFACEMLDHGYREFVVDLAGCVTMDSTFMGTMARLALRLRELGRTSPHHSLRKSQPTTFQTGFGPDI
jgi:anti-anti-sigma regulatory factor